MPRVCVRCCVLTIVFAWLPPTAPSLSPVSAAEQATKDANSETSGAPVRPVLPVLRTSPCVAVIDIKNLESENYRLKVALADLEELRLAHQVQLQTDEEALRALEQRLQQHDIDAESCRQTAQRIVTAKAELAEKRAKFEEEYRCQEGKAYFQFYHQVTADVARFSQLHGIHLVVPYDSSELVKEASADEIRRRMTAYPLYHAKIDITDNILQMWDPPCCLPPQANPSPAPR